MLYFGVGKFHLPVAITCVYRVTIYVNLETKRQNYTGIKLSIRAIINFALVQCTVHHLV